MRKVKSSDGATVKASGLLIKFLSRTAPVKRGLNLGGPPSKAKYYLVTDSGLVP